MIHYKHIVVGTGMIGSAALRHLSLLSDSVCGIGSEEPANPENHHGVFSSHYDQGRIASATGPDPIWNTLDRLAMAELLALDRIPIELS